MLKSDESDAIIFSCFVGLVYFLSSPFAPGIHTMCLELENQHKEERHEEMNSWSVSYILLIVSRGRTLR